MAASFCVTYCRPVVTRFEKVFFQIAEEITSNEVRNIKFFLKDKISETDFNCIDTGVQLISILRRYHYLTPNNLDFIKQLLDVTRNKQLLAKVEEFEKTNRPLEDATVAKREMIRQDDAHVDLYIVVSQKKEQLSADQIDELRKALIERVVQDGNQDQHVYILYLCSKVNENDKNSTVINFVFSKYLLPDIERIQLCAINKEPWLTENGIMQLKVNGKSSINIKESVEFHTKDDVNEDVYLDKRPQIHKRTKNVVDVVLIIEMPCSVTAHHCKKMVNMFQSEVNKMSKDIQLDINLAIIQFGNVAPSSDHVKIVQEFSKEFDVKIKLQESGQCGSAIGKSGMADALAKAVEFTKGDKIRPEASKLCIVTSFLNGNTKGLQHYEGSGTNDIIKLTNDLAGHEIPVYIFGIDVKAASRKESEMLDEECLLSGVAHIGGGRYFRIPLDAIEKPENTKLVTDVLKHNVSIENEEDTANEMVRDAVNKHFGDTNEKQLANDLVEDPRYKGLNFVKLLQNGRTLEPINSIARRIALADDLTDAMQAVGRIREKEQEQCNGRQRGAQPCRPKQEGFTSSVFRSRQQKKMPDLHCDVAKAAKDCQEKPASLDSEQLADLEMASRIVRRHFYRLAYYKKQ